MKTACSVIIKVLSFALLAYSGIRIIFDCGYWAVPVGIITVSSTDKTVPFITSGL